MTISKNIATGLMGVIVAAALSTVAHAAPIVTPVGLNPGDTYRLAFVTSTTTVATSNDVNYYNNFVDTLGFAATGISGWTAIVSTANDSGTGIIARDNTNTDFNTDIGTAIYLLDGTTNIADNNLDLWDGTLDNALNIDETGVSIASGFAWTGTRADGGTQFGLGSVTGISTGGFLQFTSPAWNSAELRPNTQAYRLYAISGTLIFTGADPIHEPGMLLIFALGIAGLGYATRKRAA